jgi:hypothetical protein
MLNDIINEYFDLQKKIHAAFGYKEDWKVIPLKDHRADYWLLKDDEVIYSDVKEAVEGDNEDNLYSSEIYTQRFLPKYIYRHWKFTLVCMDTRVDGNKWLGIFDNEKELPGSSSRYDVDKNQK